jgi:hypothetical protein
MKVKANNFTPNISAQIITFLILFPVNIFLRKILQSNSFYYLYTIFFHVLLIVSFQIYLTIKGKTKLNIFKIIFFGFIAGFIISIFSYLGSCILIKGFNVFINVFKMLKKFSSFFSFMFILFGWLYGVISSGLVFLLRKNFVKSHDQ